MCRISRNVIRLCLAALGACMLSGTAQAAVLVQETFDNYSPNTQLDTASGTGQATNAVGLTGNWVLGGGVTNAAFGVTVTSGGLEFGTLNPATGNRLVWTSPANHANSLRAQLNLGDASPVTGTFYSSYLFNITTRSSVNNWSEGTGIASNTSDTSGSVRFRSLPDSINTANSAAGVSNLGTGATDATGSVPVLETTYLLIARFTNVGQALSASSSAVATMWILTLEQYQQAGAILSDSYLDSVAVGTGASNVFAKATNNLTSGGPLTLQSGNFLDLSNVAGGGATQTIAYDRITLGNSLGDVVLIPEPASLAVLAAACATGLLRRRYQ